MTRSFTPSVLFVALATVGCASAPSSAGTPIVTQAPITQRVVMAGERTLSINTMNVNAGNTSLVVASMDSAWAALRAVWTELGIPITNLVDDQHVVGNETFKTRRRIGKIPMQNILDCGSTQGMPNAETYDIMMSIWSFLAPNPKGGLNLVTRMDATGKSPNFSRDASVTCSSVGELEKVIATQVRKKTGT